MTVDAIDLDSILEEVGLSAADSQGSTANFGFLPAADSAPAPAPDSEGAAADWLAQQVVAEIRGELTPDQIAKLDSIGAGDWRTSQENHPLVVAERTKRAPAPAPAPAPDSASGALPLPAPPEDGKDMVKLFLFIYDLLTRPGAVHHVLSPDGSQGIVELAEGAEAQLQARGLPVGTHHSDVNAKNPRQTFTICGVRAGFRCADPKTGAMYPDKAMCLVILLAMKGCGECFTVPAIQAFMFAILIRDGQIIMSEDHAVAEMLDNPLAVPIHGWTPHGQKEPPHDGDFKELVGEVSKVEDDGTGLWTPGVFAKSGEIADLIRWHVLRLIPAGKADNLARFWVLHATNSQKIAVLQTEVDTLTLQLNQAVLALDEAKKLQLETSGRGQDAVNALAMLLPAGSDADMNLLKAVKEKNKEVARKNEEAVKAADKRVEEIKEAKKAAEQKLRTSTRSTAGKAAAKFDPYSYDKQKQKQNGGTKRHSAAGPARRTRKKARTSPPPEESVQKTPPPPEAEAGAEAEEPSPDSDSDSDSEALPEAQLTSDPETTRKRSRSDDGPEQTPKRDKVPDSDSDSDSDSD